MGKFEKYVAPKTNKIYKCAKLLKTDQWNSRITENCLFTDLYSLLKLWGGGELEKEILIIL